MVGEGGRRETEDDYCLRGRFGLVGTRAGGSTRARFSALCRAGRAGSAAMIAEELIRRCRFLSWASTRSSSASSSGGTSSGSLARNAC